LSRGWLQTGGLVGTSLGMAFILNAYDRRISTNGNERTGASADELYRPAAPFFGFREVTEDEADGQAA
jgi:hypothetical protein